MSLDFNFTASEIIKEGKTTQASVTELKKWLFTNTEKFVPVTIQDELIVLFLLSCDNDIELAKKTIKVYYKIRRECPDIFDNRSLERAELQKAFKTMRFVTIPVRTVNNDAVVYISLRDVNTSNFEMLPSMKLSFMLMDTHQYGNPPDGIIFLVDMEGFTAMHLTKLRPDPINKYFIYLSEGLPMKFKAMYLLNSNYFLEKLLGIIKMFLNQEVMKKIQVFQPGLSLDELAEIIPKQCLPKELGGELEGQEELSDKTLQLLRNREKFWEVEEELRKSVKC